MKISGNASELLISELRVGLDYLKQLSSTAFAEVRAREQSTAWHRRFSKCPSVLAACQSELAQGRLQFRPDGVQIPFSPLMEGRDSWQAEKPFHLPCPLRVNAANDDSRVPLGLLFQPLLCPFLLSRRGSSKLRPGRSRQSRTLARQEQRSSARPVPE
jgi:hypothetical protein